MSKNDENETVIDLRTETEISSQTEPEKVTKFDKSAEIKRLIIYGVISFLPFLILIPIINSSLGEELYISDRAELIYTVGVFGMLIPSIAQILTRLTTKEGFHNNYLFPHFKGNLKYYLASVYVILGNVLIESVIVWRVFLRDFSIGELFHNSVGIAVILMQIGFSILFLLPAFGEEWGWRGYMMPKLIRLIGKPAAVIVGGIIWGLWHAPLTVSGHNFGTDYLGFPWLGIIMMCVFCIAMNAFLTLLTERTHSIYPACIAHMINNNVNLLIVFGAFSSEGVVLALTEKLDNLKSFIIILPIILIMGGVSFWLFVKKSSEK